MPEPCSTAALVELNSKVWFRRRASAVLLSNLFPNLVRHDRSTTSELGLRIVVLENLFLFFCNCNVCRLDIMLRRHGQLNTKLWFCPINLGFWEAAHLPLPKSNINTYFSLSAKCWIRGGVGGQFPRNLNWSVLSFTSKFSLKFEQGPVITVEPPLTAMHLSTTVTLFRRTVHTLTLV